MRSSETLSKPASRKVENARRTSSGDAPRSSTSSKRGSKLCAPSETRVTPQRAKQRRELRRHGLGVRLDRHLRGRAAAHEAAARARAARGTSACRRRGKTVSTSSASTCALELQLAQQRFDVAAVLAVAADDGDEVAVAAAMRAERNVHVQVADVPAHRVESPRLSTARNASCGTSTAPTCFIRFLPAFCFSSSLRLRVMSPP